MQIGSIHPKFADYLSLPILGAAVSPIQLIDKRADKTPEVESLSSLLEFLVPPTWFLRLTLIGCLLCWLISLLFSGSKKFGRLQCRRKLQMKIIASCVVIYLFFIQQFVTGNLNTESVIVETDQLLYSKKQVLETKREFCFAEKGAEEDFWKEVSSLVKMVYY